MHDKAQQGDDVCPKCGVNRRRNTIVCGIPYSFHVMCKCEAEQEEIAAKEKSKQDRLQRVKKLKRLSLLGERYRPVTFDNSKTGVNASFDGAFKRCKKYCELHEETVKNGYGIYLFGDKGVGKTHLTACMANFLLAERIPVLFTNLFEISKSVKSTFSRESSQTEQALIEKFSSIDVLFFDDLGTEIFTKNSGETWIQGLLFDLVNKRYNNQKATIFSSNYSLNELANERGVMEKTVDRIGEMTSSAVMRITGSSMRKKEHLDGIF